jgi:hypothetical protein
MNKSGWALAFAFFALALQAMAEEGEGQRRLHAPVQLMPSGSAEFLSRQLEI